MHISHPFSKLYHEYDHVTRFLPKVLRNILVTILILYLAYLVSTGLLQYTGDENNSSLVFVLAVMFVALLTDGYVYGIAASIIGAVCINYFFMYPFWAFSLSITGYPVVMVSMIAISTIVCALTSRVKLQAVESARREKDTKRLYELNTN